MTVLLTCLALGLGPPATCARGGEAIPTPRGGHATRPEVPHLAEWTCIHSGAWPDGRRVARHGEGSWTSHTGNGYFGGLQFDRHFEEAWGRDMLRKYGGRDADWWTPREQMLVANRALPTRGFSPWPLTARACGLL